MANVELKTKKNDGSVEGFLASIDDKQRREDCRAIDELMREIIGEPGAMWGSSIVGYGKYHYKYASGREADWFLVGFSPRKANITLYIMAGFVDYEPLMKQLGTYSTGKSCLYIKRLGDVDVAVLRKLVEASANHLKQSNTPNYG